MIAPDLTFEPLRPEHLDALATVLLHPEVYAHIDGHVPSPFEFRLGLERALAGPGPEAPDQVWLNFLVREGSGAMVGRLEATLHHGPAEVAFLLGPEYWGRGIASAGLHWLHQEVMANWGTSDFWATTIPANVRSQALLRRSGYREAAHPPVPLFSFEAGDLIFHRRAMP